MLLLLGMQSWAAADMVYHQLPPNCNLVHLGSRWIIQDAKGFFVGYYTPAPPPATYVPRPRPAASSQAFVGSGGGYSGSYYSGSYGYGSYARPYLQSGGFSGHYCSTPTVSKPPQSSLTQSGWYSFPSVTQSGF